MKFKLITVVLILALRLLTIAPLFTKLTGAQRHEFRALRFKLTTIIIMLEIRMLTIAPWQGW